MTVDHEAFAKATALISDMQFAMNLIKQIRVFFLRARLPVKNARVINDNVGADEPTNSRLVSLRSSSFGLLASRRYPDAESIKAEMQLKLPATSELNIKKEKTFYRGAKILTVEFW